MVYSSNQYNKNHDNNGGFIYSFKENKVKIFA